MASHDRVTRSALPSSLRGFVNSIRPSKSGRKEPETDKKASSSTTPQPSPYPDYMLDPDAVCKDSGPWRSGSPPDYANTRRVWRETKSRSHAPASLPILVENLVKNWEIEASFKVSTQSWRTVDPTSYKFSVNGGPPQSAEHMLKVGTYNAIITAPNAFYSADHSDFEKSHKTFKAMMPTFAWEVLEVYCGPPRVVFKWRHWGEMKEDYVGWDDKGNEVRHQAHGNLLDISGLCIAKLNDTFQITNLEVWFDPMDMFRQFTPKKLVDKAEAVIVNPNAGSDVTSVKQQVPGEGQCPFTPSLAGGTEVQYDVVRGT